MAGEERQKGWHNVVVVVVNRRMMYPYIHSSTERTFCEFLAYKWCAHNSLVNCMNTFKKESHTNIFISGCETFCGIHIFERTVVEFFNTNPHKM